MLDAQEQGTPTASEVMDGGSPVMALVTPQELETLPSYLHRQINCEIINTAIGKIEGLLSSREKKSFEVEEFVREHGDRLTSVVLVCLTKLNRLTCEHSHGIATYHLC